MPPRGRLQEEWLQQLGACCYTPATKAPTADHASEEADTPLKQSQDNSGRNSPLDTKLDEYESRISAVKTSLEVEQGELKS